LFKLPIFRLPVELDPLKASEGKRLWIAEMGFFTRRIPSCYPPVVQALKGYLSKCHSFSLELT